MKLLKNKTNLTLLLLLILVFKIKAQTNTFPASGNVGIGTVNPTEKLEIEGGSANTFLKLHVSSGIEKVGIKMLGGSSGVWDLFHNNTNNSLNIAEDGTDHFIVTSGGNIGMGIANPGSYKLAVNGTIHSKEVKVDLIGWADYVFKEGYSLPTLEEVENHIKEKGHLINLPSAAEVEANGVQLGEMNKLLLEKIEELTLYIIQQEKELQQQAAQLNALKKLEQRVDRLEDLD